MSRDLDDIGEMSPPSVVLGVMPSYLRSLPMMVSLTVRNTAPDMIYMGLPFVEWFGSALDARWMVRTEAGACMEAGSAAMGEAAGDDGFGLDPGDESTMLVDLAALLPDLPAGRHTLKVEYPVDSPVLSEPAVLEVGGVVGLDAEIAQAVKHGTSGDHTWRGFFDGDWAWEQIPPLQRASAPLRQALLLHLFLHRAFFGDEGVTKLAVDELDELKEGPLEAEAAVLRHEIMFSSGHPSVAEQWKQYIAQRWPGLGWRTEQSEQGFGFLTVNRKDCQERLVYRPTDEIDSVLRP